MRLLYVIDSLAPGGAETSLAEMAPGLVAHGIELHVLPLGPRLDLAPRLQSAGAVVHRRVARPGRLNSVREVTRVARSISPDLIHTTLYEADLAGRVGAQALRIPSSTSLVGDTYAKLTASRTHAEKLRLALVADRVTAATADQFHAVSVGLAQSAIKHLRIPADKITVISRGRSAERLPFQPDGVREAVRRSLNLNRDAKILLAVGRLEPVKGLGDLIDALPVVVDSEPSTVLLVAGKDGKESGRLRQAATASGLDIRFLGHRRDIPDLLAAADLLCFPSHSEGSPGTLIEAMAVGCPIVASDIPANVEVLGAPGLTAMLTPVRQPAALASTIVEALHDPAGTVSKAVAAHERFETEFRIENVSTRMGNFFMYAAAPKEEGLVRPTNPSALSSTR